MEKTRYPLQVVAENWRPAGGRALGMFDLLLPEAELRILNCVIVLRHDNDGHVVILPRRLFPDRAKGETVETAPEKYCAQLTSPQAQERFQRAAIEAVKRLLGGRLPDPKRRPEPAPPQPPAEPPKPRLQTTPASNGKAMAVLLSLQPSTSLR